MDIQPIACQIAKLRFFISLIVEQVPNDDPDKNYGIRPLPNLETRIVAANTLIGLESPEKELRSDAADETKNWFAQGARELFQRPHATGEAPFRDEDNTLRQALAIELEKCGFRHDSAHAMRNGTHTTRTRMPLGSSPSGCSACPMASMS